MAAFRDFNGKFHSYMSEGQQEIIHRDIKAGKMSRTFHHAAALLCRLDFGAVCVMPTRVYMDLGAK